MSIGSNFKKKIQKINKNRKTTFRSSPHRRRCVAIVTRRLQWGNAIYIPAFFIQLYISIATIIIPNELLTALLYTSFLYQILQKISCFIFNPKTSSFHLRLVARIYMVCFRCYSFVLLLNQLIQVYNHENMCGVFIISVSEWKYIFFVIFPPFLNTKNMVVLFCNSLLFSFKKKNKVVLSFSYLLSC